MKHLYDPHLEMKNPLTDERHAGYEIYNLGFTLDEEGKAVEQNTFDYIDPTTNEEDESFGQIMAAIEQEY